MDHQSQLILNKISYLFEKINECKAEIENLKLEKQQILVAYKEKTDLYTVKISFEESL